MSDSLGASSDAASLDGASLHEGQVDGDDRGRAEGSQAPDGGSIQSVGTGTQNEVPEVVLPELVELHLAVVDKVVKRSGAVELFHLRLSLRAT